MEVPWIEMDSWPGRRPSAFSGIGVINRPGSGRQGHHVEAADAQRLACTAATAEPPHDVALNSPRCAIAKVGCTPLWLPINQAARRGIVLQVHTSE